jgi:hypothetical protein
MNERQTKSNLLERLWHRFAVPRLTPQRIAFAFTVSVVTDSLQLLLGPLGWFFFDEALDVIAMVLTSAALGFHLLLLPTFVIEFIPGPDMLPTWTACTAAVVVLRRRAQPPPPPPVFPEKMAKVSSVSTPAEEPPDNLASERP